MPALSKSDSEVVYITRGLGIILVVVGHYLWHPNWTWSPYLFHMPLFFLLGGIVAKPIENFHRWVTKVVRAHLGYYIVWYTLLALLTWAIVSSWQTSIVFYLGQGLESLWLPLAHNSHNNSLFMVGWFIIAYGLVSTLFSLFITFVGSRVSKHSVVVLGLLIGYLGIEVVAPYYHLERNWPWNLLCQVCVGWMFFSLGFVLKDVIKHLASVLCLVVSWSIVAMLVMLGLAHELGMSWSQYPDGFIGHVAVSLLGSAGIIAVAHACHKLAGSHHLMRIGQWSKPIMTLHMTFFVILDLIFAKLGLFDGQAISALNHYISPLAFWLYLLVGIYGPIAVERWIIRLKGVSVFTLQKSRQY